MTVQTLKVLSTGQPSTNTLYNMCSLYTYTDIASIMNSNWYDARKCTQQSIRLHSNLYSLYRVEVFYLYRLLLLPFNGLFPTTNWTRCMHGKCSLHRQTEVHL